MDYWKEVFKANYLEWYEDMAFQIHPWSGWQAHDYYHIQRRREVIFLSKNTILVEDECVDNCFEEVGRWRLPKRWWEDEDKDVEKDRGKKTQAIEWA